MNFKETDRLKPREDEQAATMRLRGGLKGHLSKTTQELPLLPGEAPVPEEITKEHIDATVVFLQSVKPYKTRDGHRKNAKTRDPRRKS